MQNNFWPSKMQIQVFVSVTIVFIGFSESSQEPTCYSKFDWQEKLLEKTIRTELQMQEYLKTMEKAMEAIRAHKEEFEEMKRSITNTIEEIKLGVQTTTEQLIANVTKLKEHMYTRTITFNAKTPLDFTPGTKQIIIFQTVLQNEGNAYDSATGIFTAPVNGTYFFRVQLCADHRNSARFQLAVDDKDDTFLAISHYNHDADSTSTSGSVAHFLSEGQRVWVQASYNSGLDDNSICLNQFSGKFSKSFHNVVVKRYNETFLQPRQDVGQLFWMFTQRQMIV